MGVMSCETRPLTAPSEPSRDTSAQAGVLAAALVTVVLWASAFIGIRSAGGSFGPGAMALLRMAVATVLLGALVLHRGARWPGRRSWPLIAVWGLLWFCVYNIALNSAERLVDAGTAATLVNVCPLIVIALGGIFLGEGFPKQLLVGAPIAFAGVVIIGTQGSPGRVTTPGVLLALLAASCWAVCTIVQKRLLRTEDATTLTWLGALIGTTALLPWAGALAEDLAGASAEDVWAVAYLGAFPTAVGFTTWAYVLARSSAGRTASTTYVVPAIAILMGWALLDEAPTVGMLIGALVSLVGVAISRREPDARR